MTTLAVVTHSDTRTAPEAIVRFVTENELSGGGIIINGAIDAAVRSKFVKGTFQAKAEQMETVPALGLHQAEYIVFVGFEPGTGTAGIRTAAAAAAKALKGVRAERAEFALAASVLERDIALTGAEAAAQALAEGLLLALHDRLPLRKETKERYAPVSAHFALDEALAASKEEWERGAARGQIMAHGVCYARDLTNLPGNDLTPERLAFHAEELARELELDIEVMDEWDAAEQEMGGLLAVGQGSANPPRMIVLHYEGNPQSEDKWGLIGKGITFDTGGISLKRAAGMEEMISDMGGAAAVLGAVSVLARLKAPVNVVAVIPAAENMPSDRAFKPGDVLRTMSGYTVEVVNTDAEGRLVLADGMTTAIRRGAVRLIDVATLTGNVISALGYEATGAVTNDQQLMDRVMEASARSGERIWQLPSYPEYKKALRSDAADLKNGGGKFSGAIVGGLFIGHFAEGLPWVHLDIGGTAWLESARGWEPKWATGVMVRTIAELLA